MSFILHAIGPGQYGAAFRWAEVGEVLGTTITECEGPWAYSRGWCRKGDVVAAVQQVYARHGALVAINASEEPGVWTFVRRGSVRLACTGLLNRTMLDALGQVQAQHDRWLLWAEDRSSRVVAPLALQVGQAVSDALRVVLAVQPGGAGAVAALERGLDPTTALLRLTTTLDLLTTQGVCPEAEVWHAVYERQIGARTQGELAHRAWLATREQGAAA